MPTKWKDVSTAEKDRLAKLCSESSPVDAEADLLGMKPASLLRYIRQYIYYRSVFLVENAVTAIFDDSPVKRYTDFITMTTDNVMIISDTEIPDHNPLYLLLALYMAMAHGIKDLIIAGDLIATDQAGLVSWITTWVDKDELNFEDAISVVVMILKEFEKWFTTITIIEGNHDDRIARATGGQVHFGMLIKDTKAVYSRYAFMWLETSRGPVKIVHPSNFSGDPVTLGQFLYNTEPRKCHYVVAHCHRRQDGWSPDGAFEIHALGTGRDQKKTKYKATKVNKHKQWDSSFLMIKDGYQKPLDLNSTNWKEELGFMYEAYINHPLYQKLSLFLKAA